MVDAPNNFIFSFPSEMWLNEVFFLHILVLQSATCAIPLFADFVIDFIEKDNLPTTVTALINWSNDNILYFSRKCLNASLLFNVIKSTNNNDFLQLFDNLHHRLFMVDMAIPNFEDLLVLANNSDLFNNRYRWIFLSSTNNITNNLDVLIDYNIRIDSRVYFVYFTTSRNVQVDAIFKMEDNCTQFSKNEVALWNDEMKSFDYFNKLIVSRNRTNLQGKSIRIATVISRNDTLERLWDLRYKRYDSVTKIPLILTFYLMEILNSSGILQIHRDWAITKGNDTNYGGMAGDIKRKTADIAGGVIFIKQDRISSMEFVIVTTPVRFFFIFKEPPLSLVGNVYLLTFETSIWYATLALILIATVVIYVTLIWDWKLRNFFLPEEEVGEKPKMMEIVVYQVKAVCQQGFEIVPKCSSGRIALISTVISFMFLYNSFSCNIVALLRSTSHMIQTLEDVAESRIKIGIENKAYNKYYLSLEKDPVVRTIYDTKIAPKGHAPAFMSADEGVEKVRTDFFAFYGETVSLYDLIQRTFMEHEKCGLKEMEFLRFPFPWNVIAKNSIYREHFKVGLRKLKESGINDRILNLFISKIPLCNENSGNFVSVGLIDCKFAFTLYTAGLILSFFLFVLEKIYSIKQKKHRKKLMQENLDIVQTELY